jgi:hypothetical protein
LLFVARTGAAGITATGKGGADGCQEPRLFQQSGVFSGAIDLA